MLYLSSTQLTAFSECPRKWFYNYHMRRCRPSNSAMKRGTTFHRIFELFHKEGLALEEIPSALLKESDEYAEHLGTCMAAFVGYQKAHPPLKFVEVDGKKAIEQEFEMQLEDDVIVRGKIDYIKEIGNKRYICDIKCTGMYLADNYFSQFELCFQSMLYSYVGANYWEDIEGFMIDAVMIRKDGKMNYDRCFYPLLGNLDEFVDEIYRTANFIKNHLPDEDAFEHRWTSCTNKFGKCPYFEVCKAPRHMRHKLLGLDDFTDYVSIYASPEAE